MKRIAESKAAESLALFVILRRGRLVAKVLAHYGSSRCAVNVIHYRHGSRPGGFAQFQHGSASGYGYDKFTDALSGLSIDGHVMSDHCGQSRKRPRCGYFRADYKAPRGWRLANPGQYLPDGKRRRSFDWQDQARSELGESADYAAVNARAKELESAAVLVRGYDSCIRDSGLTYLESLGYTVERVL